MLTPGPALARRPRFTRPGWKGMGFRGLGQDCAWYDSMGNCYDANGNVIASGSMVTGSGTTNPADCLFGVDASGQCATAGSVNLPSKNTSSSQSGKIDWTQIAVAGITATGKAVTSAQTNPLLHLQPGMTYQSTPQGGIFVSTAGAVPGGATTGLTTTTLGNLLPILLVGGVVMFMMSRR